MAMRHFRLLNQQLSLLSVPHPHLQLWVQLLCCWLLLQILLCFASPNQSSFRAPSFRGPLAALRSALLASSSFLLSSRFFLDSSALLRPGGLRGHADISKMHICMISADVLIERKLWYSLWFPSTDSQLSSVPQSPVASAPHPSPAWGKQNICVFKMEGNL